MENETQLVGDLLLINESLLPSYIYNKSSLYQILNDMKKVSWDREGVEVSFVS